MKTILIAFLLSLSNLTFAGTPLPADSVLQLGDAFTNQDGTAFTLDSRRGHPQLVAMFYTSCSKVCPLIIDTGLAVDKALTAIERAKLRVLLISLDPGNDSPQALMSVAKKRSLDRTRWTLARADANGVRKLAALLGVRYRRLQNGEFNHTSAVFLLDADGRILARTEQMGTAPEAEFLAKVHAALK